MYKGPDCATVLTEGENEIHSYLDASSFLCTWNGLLFIVYLFISLVVSLWFFCTEDEVENVLNNVKDAQLLGWFKANQGHNLLDA